LKTIVIFRHAEKPDDPKDHHLSLEGQVRAERLVDFFHDRYGKPDYIFAARSSQESHRPVETATPLAKKNKKEINQTWEDKDFRKLAAHLSHEKYNDKTIAVFWHHGHIPQLIKCLGGPTIDKWPEDVFDEYIELKFPSFARFMGPF
jgi:hypothetical protein